MCHNVESLSECVCIHKSLHHLQKKYENWKNLTPPRFHSCHDNSSESHILLKFQIPKAF